MPARTGSRMTRVLAAVCGCCPFCIAQRAWPASRYGRFWRWLERGCPFCRAYDRLGADKETSDKA